jgi:hypothetical protein
MMRNPLLILAFAALITDIVAQDDATFTRDAACNVEEGCSLDKRDPQIGYVFDSGQIDPMAPGSIMQYRNWYCNSLDQKWNCGSKDLPEKLTHEVCTLQCRCHPTSKSWDCMTYSSCSPKTVSCP